MSARPLTPDEARRVTTCPECGHAWWWHGGDDGCYPCPCPRSDETLRQAAALRDEWQAAAWERGVLDQDHSVRTGSVRGNPYREADQ